MVAENSNVTDRGQAFKYLDVWKDSANLKLHDESEVAKFMIFETLRII